MLKRWQSDLEEEPFLCNFRDKESPKNGTLASTESCLCWWDTNSGIVSYISARFSNFMTENNTEFDGQPTWFHELSLAAIFCQRAWWCCPHQSLSHSNSGDGRPTSETNQDPFVMPLSKYIDDQWTGQRIFGWGDLTIGRLTPKIHVLASLFFAFPHELLFSGRRAPGGLCVGHPREGFSFMYVNWFAEKAQTEFLENEEAWRCGRGSKVCCFISLSSSNLHLYLQSTTTAGCTLHLKQDLESLTIISIPKTEKTWAFSSCKQTKKASLFILQRNILFYTVVSAVDLNFSILESERVCHKFWDQVLLFSPSAHYSLVLLNTKTLFSGICVRCPHQIRCTCTVITTNKHHSNSGAKLCRSQPFGRHLSTKQQLPQLPWTCSLPKRHETAFLSVLVWTKLTHWGQERFFFWPITHPKDLFQKFLHKSYAPGPVFWEDNTRRLWWSVLQDPRLASSPGRSSWLVSQSALPLCLQLKKVRLLVFLFIWLFIQNNTRKYRPCFLFLPPFTVVKNAAQTKSRKTTARSICILNTTRSQRLLLCLIHFHTWHKKKWERRQLQNQCPILTEEKCLLSFQRIFLSVSLFAKRHRGWLWRCLASLEVWKQLWTSVSWVPEIRSSPELWTTTRLFERNQLFIPLINKVLKMQFKKCLIFLSDHGKMCCSIHMKENPRISLDFLSLQWKLTQRTASGCSCSNAETKTQRYTNSTLVISSHMSCASFSPVHG